MLKIKLFCHYFTQKMEKYAFKVPDEISSMQNLGDLSTINTLISYPNLFYRYLKSEMRTSLYYNLLYMIILFWYLPAFFLQCLKKDRALTLWLLFLSIMNIIVILPKMLVLKKLNCFASHEDRINLSRSLWLFIRCKVYNLITKVSKLTFFIYLVGLFRFWQIQMRNENLEEKTSEEIFLEDNASHFFDVCFVVIIGFILRLLLSFMKFNFIFHPKILEKNSGLMRADLNLLKIEEYNQEFKERIGDKTECAICYEDFQLKENVRMMNCTGKHIFHVECIDKWLMTKKTCPTCNFNLEIYNNKYELF